MPEGGEVTVTVFDAGGARQATAADLPALLAGVQSTVWVDVAGPEGEGLRVLHEVFRFHPLAIEDTRNQRQRPKVEDYNGYLFLILNPARPGADPEFRELDVFVGPRYLVTVHPAAEPAIAEAAHRIGRASGLVTSGRLLYTLVDVVVDGYFPLLDRLDEEIDSLEDAVLARPEPDALARLFRLKRALLEVRRVVGPQRDMFNVLMRRDLPYLDLDALQYYLRDVYDHLLRITDMVDTFRDLLTSTIDLYMSSASNQLNRVVNRLTVITVLIGTLAVITGFYGMNFEVTWPPFGAPWGVGAALGMMAVAVAALLAIFRRLRWV